MGKSKETSFRQPRQSVTLADIARRCGVSTMTVSLALRENPRRVSAGTVAHIKSVAAEMGYDPQSHLAARRLISRRFGQPVLNKIIALVLPNVMLKHPYYAHIVSGVLEVTQQEHFGLLIGYEVEEPGKVYPEFVGHGEVDGLLCYYFSRSYADTLPDLRQTQFGQRPVVVMNGEIAGESQVIFDDSTGGYLQTTHLLDHGHRHILHFYQQNSYTYCQRLVGCRQALLDRGLDPDNCFHSIHDHLPADAVGMYDWIDALPSILSQTGATAILARYDEHAQRVFRALKQHGFRVPEDISLIGYNDTDEILNNDGENLLTTVRLSLEEMGRRAARLLIQRVTGQITDSISLVLPVELVVRQSVASPDR